MRTAAALAVTAAGIVLTSTSASADATPPATPTSSWTVIGGTANPWHGPVIPWNPSATYTTVPSPTTVPAPAVTAQQVAPVTVTVTLPPPAASPTTPHAAGTTGIAAPPAGRRREHRTPAAQQTVPSSPRFWEVEAGDTLTGISRIYRIPVEAIAAANGLADPDLILIGQRLVIPWAAPADS